MFGVFVLARYALFFCEVCLALLRVSWHCIMHPASLPDLTCSRDLTDCLRMLSVRANGFCDVFGRLQQALYTPSN